MLTEVCLRHVGRIGKTPGLLEHVVPRSSLQLVASSSDKVCAPCLCHSTLPFNLLKITHPSIRCAFRSATVSLDRMRDRG